MERDYARLHVRLVAIGVELERDVSVADWILSGLEPWGERLSIGILLPGGFDAYARVLHPVERWDGLETTILTWAEIGLGQGVSLTPEVQFDEVVGYEGDDWSELLNLGPEPGRLPTDTCRMLATVLRKL